MLNRRWRRGEEDEPVAGSATARSLPVEQQLFVANAVLFTAPPRCCPSSTRWARRRLTINSRRPAGERAGRQLATVVARYAFLLIAACYRSYVLKLFGVSLPIVRDRRRPARAASGWRMLNDDRSNHRTHGRVDA
jgi:hypothetical protein